MLRDGTNRLAELGAALQLDGGRWLWLLCIVTALAGVLSLGDIGSELLRYDRGAIAAGGWWRLLTAHIVHLDAHHLILNSLGLVLLWSLFAADFGPVQWLCIVLAAALAISAGLWWGSPRVTWYVGTSGVLHAVMAAGTTRHIVERVWDRWILLGVLCAKLVYEQLASAAPALVVVDAHLYGALSGFAVGAALCAGTAIIRHRFHASRL